MPNKILILFRFWQLQKFPNFKRSYLKTSIMAREYSFDYSLQVMQFASGKEHMWRVTAKGTLSRLPLCLIYNHSKPINNKYLMRIINSLNSGPCHLLITTHNWGCAFLHRSCWNKGIEQACHTIYNSVHSEQYCARTIDPLSVHSFINLCWVVACIRLYWTTWLEKTAALMAE